MKRFYTLMGMLLPAFIFAQISFTSSITPDLSPYGEPTSYPGQGEYEIFLGNDNILDRPVILVDGFDPGDTRDISTIYNSLTFNGSAGTENLADLIRAEGFDIIVLNFPTYTRTADGASVDGGADFMERNAMLLVDLINQVNADKAANSPEQNVIIGASMGGIISKYALSYMEANALNADTRLFISFDAPHLGANVPIGLQHQLNYLAFNDTNAIAELQPLIDGFLKTPAARQLLIDHFEPHLLEGSQVEFDPNATLPEPHPFRVQFESNLQSLTSNGFPENVRNVAVVNGSGINAPYFAIGDSGDVVTNSYPILSTVQTIEVPTPFGNVTIDVEIDINMTPAAGVPDEVSRFFAPLLPLLLPNVESLASSGRPNFDGVDAAPGGLFDLSTLTDGIGSETGEAADFLAALAIDKFNFIPTVSALALEITNNEPDWFHDINLAGRATTDITPFDNTFIPDDNQPHVQLTNENVTFTLNEILNSTLTSEGLAIVPMTLARNPIEDVLVINTTQTSDAIFRIYDLSGKEVLMQSVRLSASTELKVNALSSGFYILNIVTEDQHMQNIKFLKQ